MYVCIPAPAPNTKRNVKLAYSLPNTHCLKADTKSMQLKPVNTKLNIETHRTQIHY